MRENFDQSLLWVLANEGKFSDIPEDRGGPTNQGITLKTLIDFHRNFDYGDFDCDGDVDIDDIILLDEPEEAAPIYKKYFWDVIRGDDLTSGIDYVVFDSAVNHGPKNAGRFLQRALNRQGARLMLDGDIGRLTIRAAQNSDAANLLTDIVRERDIFYRKIVASSPSQEKFFKGWMNRLSDVVVNARNLI